MDTQEELNYILSLTKKDDCYVAELGCTKLSGKGTMPIAGDFYDVDMLINTLVDIFTKFHLEGIESDFIVYKFSPTVDKSYVLLVITLFRNYLKNYYDLNPDLNDLSNVNNINRLIIQTTFGKGSYVDDKKIKKLKSI